MKIISLPSEMQATSVLLRQQGRRIGLVPTMGCLHRGHLSLIRQARTESEITVVSIFVNPIQFGPSEDFARYPRTFDKDTELCREEKVDIIFNPSPDQMYDKSFSTFIEETSLSSGLCGKARPGHFRGVTTVVAKLFNIVLPHVAVFGQKDAQQAAVIKQMVRNLNFPVQVLVAPTVRETDGLALSSRNIYLSPEERRRAPDIYASLCMARDCVAEGVLDSAKLQEQIKAVLNKGKPDIQIEYLEIVDIHSLVPVKIVKPGTLITIAAKLGKTRLIDNVVLMPEPATPASAQPQS